MDFRTETPITHTQATTSINVALVPNPIYIKQIYFHRFRQVYQTKIQLRFNHNLRKALNLHKCWLNLTITGTHSTLTGERFIRVLWNRLLHYFRIKGFISINIVISALNYVLYNEFQFVSSVIQDESVAMKLY
ncbi:C3 [Tomato curly top virus]|nr:C3 [Tomato curly top virus]BBD96262.1 C3 [Tomato curly top virus]BBD96268.1 C3 [Tomato curly top virus]BBE00592.1 C3 [Tomato curly top virus]BBE00598.1 C3 [Tomato curly top virus]